MFADSTTAQNACPPCTDFTIVIPFNHSELKYDRTVYAPSMTAGRATTEEIEFILGQLEAYAKKIPTPFTMAIISFLFAVLPALGCAYLSIFVHYLGFILIWCGLILYLLILIICLVAWRKSEVTQARNQACQTIQICQNSFQAKGLRWHIPLSFPLWVEIYKDYREHSFMQPIQPFQPFQQMIPQGNMQMMNQPGYPVYGQRQENVNMYQPPVINQAGNQGYPQV